MLPHPIVPDYARLNDIQSHKMAQSRKNVDETIRWITLDLIPEMAADYYDMKIVGIAVNNRDAVTDLKIGSGSRRAVTMTEYKNLGSSIMIHQK